ncbi:Uncharacterised protein [Candidatus Burarchaeum australiense]|nr:Uncharacterised protein [Candidatus Burarchaeum australiense]
MQLPLFLRVLLLSTALSLLVYTLAPGMTLGTLARLLALSAAMSMLVPLTYPHIRGVRKGDTVMVVNSPQKSIIPPIPFLNFGGNVSLDDGRLGSHIRVSMPDGTWREAVVLAYAGMVTPARVRLLEADVSISIL